MNSTGVLVVRSSGIRPSYVWPIDGFVLFSGLVAADVCAAYGADSISGNILLAAIPYLAAYPAIVNPFIQELSPRLFSSDVVTFSKACADFADSCVSEGFPVSDETKWLWAGIAATQVRSNSPPYTTYIH
jgi:hypothetical protein